MQAITRYKVKRAFLIVKGEAANCAVAYGEPEALKMPDRRGATLNFGVVCWFS